MRLFLAALQSLLLMVTVTAAAEPTVVAPASALSLERGSFQFQERELAYFCTGSGAPTLILEAPSGISNEEAFGNVLPALAERGRVCAYERAFYGASDPLPAGAHQSVDDYAAELRTFLGSGAVDGPLVFVGFSYGGFVARYYTGHHPDQVAGIVLIDTPHVEWLRAMKAELSAEDWQKVEDIMDWFLDNRGHDVWTSQFEVEAAPDLPDDLPIAVVTRGQDHERMRLSGISEAGFRSYNDIHFRLAPELLDLSERTIAFTAPASDHMIPDAEPEVVLAALDAVLSLLESNAAE